MLAMLTQGAHLSIRYLLILATFAPITLVCQPVAAQTQQSQKENSDVQQLKEKLQVLEQTVEELKAKLAAMDQAQKSAQAGQPTSSTSQQLSEHTSNTESTATTVKVSSNTTIGAPAPPPVSSTTKHENTNNQNTKSENTLEIYGYAMLDMGYQFNQNDPNWFDVLRPSKLPAFPDEFAPSGKVFYGVRQSQLGVRSDTPTDFGQLKTIFEFDLFGVGIDAGQTTFHLRHAWGELEHVGAGQTWTTFMDADVLPKTLEYWGPPGIVNFRNVQARWMPVTGDNSVAIALERPGATADQGIFADRIELQGIRPKFDLPDLTGNVRFNRDWGHFQASGIVKRTRWVDTNHDQFNLSGTAVGWGVDLTSGVNVSKNDVGKFAVVYGKGIENYMNDAPVDIGIAFNPVPNPTRPIIGVSLPVFGMEAFLEHNWNKQFSSTVGYSMLNIQNSAAEAPDAFHRGYYAIANLLFYPTANTMVGGEFQWGRRANFSDGFAANDYRLQFSFRYNFSRIFGLNGGS